MRTEKGLTYGFVVDFRGDGSLEELARIQIETTASGVVARISGEVDISNVDLIRRQLTDSVPSTVRGLVVDVSETSYLDSSGVYLLFELARRSTAAASRCASWPRRPRRAPACCGSQASTASFQ